MKLSERLMNYYKSITNKIKEKKDKKKDRNWLRTMADQRAFTYADIKYFLFALDKHDIVKPNKKYSNEVYDFIYFYTQTGTAIDINFKDSKGSLIIIHIYFLHSPNNYEYFPVSVSVSNSDNSTSIAGERHTIDMDVTFKTKIDIDATVNKLVVPAQIKSIKLMIDALSYIVKDLSEDIRW